jgi:hypothetical protein
MKNLVPVDHSALKTNQAVIITLLIIAFVLNLPWLVALVCAIMLAGSLILKRPGFYLVYEKILKPTGWIKADVLQDNREPHVFAQGVGGVFLLVSSLALFLGASLAGWILNWIVVALAALNLFAGFCVGCAMYYWLHQLNIPGFSRSAPQGSFPGMRPEKSQS